MKTKFFNALSLALIVAMLVTSLGLAAELVTAEVTGTMNDVTVVQGGGNVASTLNVSATGKIKASITSANPSKFFINTSYSFTGEVLSSSAPSQLHFWSSGTGCSSGGDPACDVTWTGATTPYNVSVSVSADSSTAAGNYSITLSCSPSPSTGDCSTGNESIDNPISGAPGQILGDQTVTTVTVHVRLAAPSTLSATGVSQTQIDLSWADNSTGENNFSVERSASSSGPFSLLATVGAGVTSYSDMSVSCGETWHYRVRATKSTPTGLDSDYSSVASGSTSPCAPADTTAPVISPNISGTLGSNGWYTSNVTLTWTVSEPESPDSLVLTGCVDQNITTDQAAVDYSCEASSDGGSAGPVIVSIMRDATAPTVTASPSPVANANGWNNTDVTVSYSCTDNGPSGVDAAASDLADDLLTASGTASGTCVDLAGNSAEASYSAQIDKVNPIISGSRTPAANANGWNNTDVVVSFSCTDNGGSGIDTNTVAGATVSAEGASQSVTNTGSCTDKAGNTADSATASGINIDKTLPTASASASPAANANGWNNTNVTVSFSGNDGTGSGIDFCDAAVLLSSEGANQSASGTCTDKAGNVSAPATASGINIDKTAPTSISFIGGPAAGSSYYFGSVPAAPTCTADGAISGLASCTVSGYGTTVGSHTMTATATDNAGNSGTATRSYTVLAWTLNGFYQPVDMGGVWNTVRSGSTVPLKFEIFAGSTELTDPSIVNQPLRATQQSCSGGTTDDIELLSSGATTLRYDATAGQFIYNWQTPRGKAGYCYVVTVTMADGSSISANFRLK